MVTRVRRNMEEGLSRGLYVKKLSHRDEGS